MKKSPLFFLLLIFFSAGLEAREKFRLERPKTDTIRVPPLFWYETDPKTQTKFLMALLLYWRGESPAGTFNLFAPMYYDSKTPGESLRVLLPVHYRYSTKAEESILWGPYFKKKTPFSQTSFLIPFFWQVRPFDKTQRSYQLLFPIYLRWQERDTESYTSPFFWIHNDSETSRGLIPPYFWRRTADSATEVGFPLYWRFLRKEGGHVKDIQVAVPWFRLRSESKDFRSFFPLYWGQTRTLQDEDSTGAVKTSRWDVLFPLLYHADLPDGSEKIVTPLWSKFRDPDGKTFGHGLISFYSNEAWGGKTAGMIPFFIYREDPHFYKFRFLLYTLEKDSKAEHVNTSLFPLFKYKRDTDRKQFLTPIAYYDFEPGRSRGYFANYFWKSERLEGVARLNHQRVLFPLFWHVHSDEERTTVIPPVFAFHAHEDYRLYMMAPFYFRRVKGNDTLTFIPPIITRVSPERNWRGLFFLYWRSSRPDRHALALLPLFRKSYFPGGTSLYLPGLYVLREGDETQGVAGPYLWDHRGKTRYEIFPPLYWNFRRPTWSVKTFFPIYRFQNEAIREMGFFPLIAKTVPASSSKNTPKHFLGNSHRFLPFYFYRNLDHGYDLWLPPILGRFEKGLNSKQELTTRGRLFLLDYWERTPSTFVNRFDPLYSYYSAPDSKGFAAPTAPFPLWRYEVSGLKNPDERKSLGAVFPYYWKESKTFRRDFVLPLFYKSKTKEEDGKTEKKRKTWLLVYYDSQNFAEKKDMRLFVPVYFHFRNKEDRMTIVPPFWLDESPDHSRSILFPLYFRSDNRAAKRKIILFPGFWRSKDEAGEVILAGLLYRRMDFKNGEKISVGFPLYWNLKSKKHILSYFFPLYFRDEAVSHGSKVLFPIYWRFWSPENDVRVVPPFFSVISRTAQTKTTGFAPLWTTMRSLNSKAMSFEILGGLLAYERDALGQSELTFLYFIKL